MNELWLFPGESGGFKTPSMFSDQITAAVKSSSMLAGMKFGGMVSEIRG